MSLLGLYVRKELSNDAGFTLTTVDWAEFVSLWRSMQAMRLLKTRLDRVIRAPSRDLLSRVGLTAGIAGVRSPEHWTRSWPSFDGFGLYVKAG